MSHMKSELDFTPIQEYILEMEEDKLIMILVLGEGCETQPTSFEVFYRDRFLEINSQFNVEFEVVRVCFDDEHMPFPRPMTPSAYYFKSGDDNYMFVRHGQDALSTIEQDVGLVQNMLGGMTYAEALYDNAEDKRLIEQTETEFNKDESKSKYPSTSKMLKGFAKEVWNSAKYAGKGLPVIAPGDIPAERYSICEQCPHLTDVGRCTECGCFMKKKVNLAASSCPIGKWETV